MIAADFLKSNAVLACLVLLGTVGHPVSAQSSNAPQSSSIETEMLTYRAVESDSEAIACDIAGYLNGATPTFINSPSGAVCDVKAGTARATVVLLPFDRSQLAGFQLWRVDMVTMAELKARAAALNCPTKKAGRGASSLDAALADTPAGPPLAAAQTVLSLLATTESTSAVTGTVQDQAFLNAVARQLRSLSLAVVMPSAYTPFSLSPLDEAKSPFLANVEQLETARTCLSGLQAKPDAQAATNKDTVAQTIAEIDAFLLTLGGSAPPPADTPKPAAADATKPPPAPAKTSAATYAPSPAASSHLLSVLAADGLAQKLGVDPATGRLPEGGATVHLLLVQALESGGTVEKTTSVLGTHIHYSGGAVGSYALFHVDGLLECSGSVYDYAGPVRAKDFQRQVDETLVNPAKQVVFQRGSCSALQLK